MLNNARGITLKKIKLIKKKVFKKMAINQFKTIT